MIMHEDTGKLNFVRVDAKKELNKLTKKKKNIKQVVFIKKTL